jgi:hypothetical protein
VPTPPEPTNPDVRPGNGYGDDNHEHTGPPGQDAEHGNSDHADHHGDHHHGGAETEKKP